MVSYWKQIEKDLDWRQSELAILKLLVVRSNPKTQKALLRSLLAMLYAHYQGFCVNSLLVYTKAVVSQGGPTKSHKEALVMTSLSSVLKKIRTMNDADILYYVSNEFDKRMNAAIAINEKDFETSNLYPNVLEDLCAKVGLECPAVIINRSIIKSLVSRRNDIAHGQENDVRDLGEYNKYENAAYEVMYSLALSIEEALRFKYFLQI